MKLLLVIIVCCYLLLIILWERLLFSLMLFVCSSDWLFMYMLVFLFRFIGE